MPLGTPITVRFDDEELEALRRRAVAEERPMGFLVRKAVRLLFLAESGSVSGVSGDRPTATPSDAQISAAVIGGDGGARSQGKKEGLSEEVNEGRSERPA